MLISMLMSVCQFWASLPPELAMAAADEEKPMADGTAANGSSHNHGDCEHNLKQKIHYIFTIKLGVT